MHRIFLKRMAYWAAAMSIAVILGVTGGCKKESDSAGAGPAGGAAASVHSTRATGPAPTSKPDLQTPKAVTLAFSRALSAGDVETARALSTGDAGPQMLESLAKLASATAQLQNALKAKFGERATHLE